MPFGGLDQRVLPYLLPPARHPREEFNASSSHASSALVLTRIYIRPPSNAPTAKV